MAEGRVKQFIKLGGIKVICDGCLNNGKCNGDSDLCKVIMSYIEGEEEHGEEEKE